MLPREAVSRKPPDWLHPRWMYAKTTGHSEPEAHAEAAHVSEALAVQTKDRIKAPHA